MKQTRSYPAVTVSSKAERSILEGHPWIYDTELTEPEETGALKALENGGLVDVVSQKGRYLGTGLLSRQSKIRIRLISRNAKMCIRDRSFPSICPEPPGNFPKGKGEPAVRRWIAFFLLLCYTTIGFSSTVFLAALPSGGCLVKESWFGV